MLWVKNSYKRRRTGRWSNFAHGCRGFTILEVSIAATIMLIAIASSLTTLQYGLRAVDTARHTTLASQVLQSTIELLRLQNWTQIVAQQATQPTASTPVTVDLGTALLPIGSGTLATTLTSIASRFTCQQLITDISGRADIKLITLEISWEGMDGRPHLLSFQTRYAKNGLSDYLYAH